MELEPPAKWHFILDSKELRDRGLIDEDAEIVVDRVVEYLETYEK
jgi:hypothetical protein